MPFSSNQEHREINPWLIAIAVMSSTFMEVLDTTVVNVSLPHIAGSLSASNDEATWTLTSYLVANAIILPMTGWLAESLRPQTPADDCRSPASRSPRFLCGLAPTLPFLILLPRDSGRLRRRSAAAVAGHPDGVFPAREARTGDGLLGAGHRGRAHARPGRSAAGSPTTTAGAGSSTSTLPIGIDRHHPDADLHLRPAIPPRIARSAASTSGASACWRRHWRFADHAR